MDQVEHQLSRLALAKAIKQGEQEPDAWNKSVIFNQPFIKDLHNKQKKVQEAAAPQVAAPQPTRQTKKKKKHTCLPSDSEESDNDDPVSSEDDEDDDIVKIVSRKPPVIKKTSTHRKSDDYDSSSPSRGSLASSISLPLTEDDEEDVKRYPAKPPPMVDPMPIDPIYLQRLQNYQYQLQLQYQQQQHYQQQHQYQQHQQYQQQQHYQQFLQFHNQPIMTPHHHAHKNKHHRHPSGSTTSGTKPKKYSSTDLRRRAEMLNSNKM